MATHALYTVPEEIKNKLQISSQELEDLKNVFSLFDPESKGSISCESFQSLLKSLGLQRHVFIIDKNSKKSCSKNFSSSNGSGEVSFTEFLQMAIQQPRTRRSSYQAESELRDAFNTFDTDNKGYLTVSDLKQVMVSLGDESITDAEILEMIKEANLNKNSLIFYDEFRSIMCRPSSDFD